MITSSSDNKLRKQVLEFVSPRANIHHSLNDGFSFIAYLDDNKIIGYTGLSEDDRNEQIKLKLKTILLNILETDI